MLSKEEIETEKKNLTKYLEERIKAVENCYDHLIEPYCDKKINIINVSLMSKKEKEEFNNKRNCLLVQKHCYEEILEIVKGEKQ